MATEYKPVALPECEALIEPGDVDETARKPQFDTIQHSLFSPDAWLVISKDMRVKMDDASRDDLVAWYQVEKQEHQGQVTAFSHKTDYLNTRLAKWRDEHPTLGAVERSVFGWVPLTLVSDDDDEDDTD